MKTNLMELAAVQELIQAGKRLHIAGEEPLLRQLPKGNWIGGTIPYFMDSSGGVCSRDRLFVTEMPEQVNALRIVAYSAEELRQLPQNNYDNGFSLIILPAGSKVHLGFAQSAPEIDGVFLTPLAGWVSGVLLDELGKVTPKVFHGESGDVFEDKAIVMHLSLPQEYSASVNIVNLFRQGDGPVIRFEETGFTATEAIIDGERQALAPWYRDHNVDTRLPLVANYGGAMINVSHQEVPPEGEVSFYAPVFAGVEYRLASAIGDYVEELEQAIPVSPSSIAFSCNCILNYLYGELEGRKLPLGGPITFGEVAYQLLNQTLVYLTIDRI